MILEKQQLSDKKNDKSYKTCFYKSEYKVEVNVFITAL